MDIHGQHEHQSLLRSEAQRDLLDAFSGSRELAQAVSSGYRRWQGLLQSRMKWEQNAESIVREREQLELQNRELTALNFSPDEWQALQADHSRLSHSASLLEATQVCLETISEGESASLVQINSVISRLKSMLQYDTNLKGILEILDKRIHTFG